MYLQHVVLHLVRFLKHPVPKCSSCKATKQGQRAAPALLQEVEIPASSAFPLPFQEARCWAEPVEEVLCPTKPQEWSLYVYGLKWWGKQTIQLPLDTVENARYHGITCVCHGLFQLWFNSWFRFNGFVMTSPPRLPKKLRLVRPLMRLSCIAHLHTLQTRVEPLKLWRTTPSSFVISCFQTAGSQKYRIPGTVKISEISSQRSDSDVKQEKRKAVISMVETVRWIQDMGGLASARRDLCGAEFVLETSCISPTHSPWRNLCTNVIMCTLFVCTWVVMLMSFILQNLQRGHKGQPQGEQPDK